MAGIQPSGNAENHFGDAGAVEPLHQSLDLNVIGFIAAKVAHRGVRRHVGEAIISPFQQQAPSLRRLEAERDSPEPAQLVAVPRHALAEAILSHALLSQPLQVQLRHEELGIVTEAFRLGNQHAVLINHRMAVPGQIGRRFARSCGRVKVSGQAARRLIRNQAVTVLVFSDRDIRGREIQDDRRPGQSGAARRRNRHPEVLADLHEEG